MTTNSSLGELESGLIFRIETKKIFVKNWTWNSIPSSIYVWNWIKTRTILFFFKIQNWMFFIKVKNHPTLVQMHSKCQCSFAHTNFHLRLIFWMNFFFNLLLNMSIVVSMHHICINYCWINMNFVKCAIFFVSLQKWSQFQIIPKYVCCLKVCFLLLEAITFFYTSCTLYTNYVC